ncbi:unnamed protein product, partial [Anisakis simplex]|uniref:Conserved plasma membrane protein n=1 Tax=Anisakis simplex TaxID=6269 RepID=A0A0M3JLT6_ANISI
MLDIAVGCFYILYATFGIVMHALEITACVRLSRQYGAFYFIAHSSTADTLMLLAFGVWKGVVILFQNEIVSANNRLLVNVVINFACIAAVLLSVLQLSVLVLSYSEGETREGKRERKTREGPK